MRMYNLNNVSKQKAQIPPSPQKKDLLTFHFDINSHAVEVVFSHILLIRKTKELITCPKSLYLETMTKTQYS